MTLVRFYLPYLKRYVGWALMAAVAVVTYGLATAAMVALIEPIFGEVLLAEGGAPASVAPVPDPAEGSGGSVLNLKQAADRAYESLKRAFGITPETVVYFAPLLLLATFVMRGVANFFSGYSFQRIGLGVTTDLRNDVYRRLLDQSSRFHARHSSGELVSRVMNDISVINLAVAARAFDSVQQSATLVLLVVLLLSTNLKLGLITLAAVPLLVYTFVRFGKSMRKTSYRHQERIAEVTALLSEGVRGHRVVKAFGMETFEDDRFREATARQLKVSLRAQMLSNLSSPVLETIVAIGTTGFLLYAGLQIRAGNLTAPLLVQFMANLLLMYDPVRRLNKINLVLQKVLAASHRVHDLVSMPNEIREQPGARPIDDLGGGIVFEDVRFAYGELPVLAGVDLTIPRGHTVAVVGPSGSGKSTLANLLPRFYDPDHGRVTIAGQDVRELRLDSLRGLVGVVTQETVLFDDTVRNNIAYGRADLSLEEVRRAARAAYADEFIQALPEGYDTRIGELGSQLSGGERQRVAIARAILKDAPILILDEATSQLDSQAEQLVQRALHNLMEGRTTLVIAHRLATVKEADSIVVLQAGKVVEQGTHASLLAAGGLYKHLCDLQFGHASEAS